MPPYARWRGAKIVGPIKNNRENELIGGLKNALERGEPLEKAKKSFLSAGYSTQEIEGAAAKVNSSNVAPPTQPQAQPAVQQKAPAAIPPQPPTASPQTPSTPQKVVPQAQPKQAPTVQPAAKPKSASRLLIIILIITSATILLGAALLGLFWDKLFGA